MNMASLESRFQRLSIRLMANRARIEIYEEMAEALDDGEPLLRFLEKKRDRYKARGKSLSQVFALWAKNMGASGSFSKAISDTVPASDVMVIKAAEVSGKLADGLKFLAMVVQETQKMKKTVISGLAMPALVFVMLTILIVMFSLFGVPIFAEVVPPDKWHPAGQLMYKIAYFVTHYGIFLGAIIAGVIGWLVWSMPNWISHTRDRMDNWLPYSMYRDYNGAIFLIVLAALLKSNVGIGNALQIIRETATPWIKRHISKMLSRLGRGTVPAEALHTGVMHEDIAYRIIDYGERSGFQSAVERIGFRSIALVTSKVGAGTKVIFICSIILAGFVLGFFVVSFMLTAQGFGDAARSGGI